MINFSQWFETKEVSDSENKISIIQDKEDLNVFKAYLDGIKVGWLELNHKDKETGKTSVWKVFVDPSFRRRGIATALYDAAEKKFGELTPSTALHDAGFDFWKNRKPKSIENQDDLRPLKSLLIGKEIIHPKKGNLEIVNVERNTVDAWIKSKEKNSTNSITTLTKKDLVNLGIISADY